jgi:catechol 2,3-dioxygenase-like lactoylglutathione lyase family enzyme
MLRTTRLALALAVFGVACASAQPGITPMKNEWKPSVLHPAALVGFGVTADSAKARAFYEGKLGFHVTSEDAQALVLDADGTMLRIQKAKAHEPRPYTVLGWNVRDLDATLVRMETAGIRCERFPGLPQDERGIMSFPGGARLVWLKDPDGNILSVAEMPP